MLQNKSKEQLLRRYSANNVEFNTAQNVTLGHYTVTMLIQSSEEC